MVGLVLYLSPGGNGDPPRIVSARLIEDAFVPWVVGPLVIPTPCQCRLLQSIFRLRGHRLELESLGALTRSATQTPNMTPPWSRADATSSTHSSKQQCAGVAGRRRAPGCWRTRTASSAITPGILPLASRRLIMPLRLIGPSARLAVCTAEPSMPLMASRKRRSTRRGGSRLPDLTGRFLRGVAPGNNWGAGGGRSCPRADVFARRSTLALDSRPRARPTWGNGINHRRRRRPREPRLSRPR